MIVEVFACYEKKSLKIPIQVYLESGNKKDDQFSRTTINKPISNNNKDRGIKTHQTISK